MKKISSKSIKRSARTILNHGWTGPVLVSLILITLMLLISAIMIPFVNAGSNRTWNLMCGAGVEFILYLFMRLFVFGADEYLLKTVRKSGASYGDLLFAFKNQPDRFLVVSLVQVGLPSVSVFPALGFIGLMETNFTVALTLLIVWCIAAAVFVTVLELSFALAPFLLLDNPGMGAKEALGMSRRLMHRHKKELFFLILSFLPWVLLVIFTAGIGELWILPYLMTSQVSFYERLVYPAELPSA